MIFFDFSKADFYDMKNSFLEKKLVKLTECN